MINKAKQFFITIIIFFASCFPSLIYAADRSSPPSMGGIASNVLEPIGIFTNAVYSICYILGAAFIMGSVVRYREYRENPSQTPISRPIAILLFGIVLLSIPIIAKLSEASTIVG